MRNSSQSYYLIALVFMGLAFGSSARAQNNTLYFMHHVPQAIHTNPALFYHCKTYIEIPVLSSISQSYANTGFGYHDAIHYGSGSNADSLLIDMNNLEKKLKKRNYIREDVSVNLMGAGFLLLEDYYVHFNVSLIAETRVGFPGDLVALKDGNWDLANGVPRDLNLSGLGVKATNYLQIAAGASTEIMSGLYVGATLKYLKGAANVSSPRTNLTLETGGDPIQIRANTDYRIRSSFPMQVSIDQQGYVSSIDLSNSFSNIVDDYILNKNHGVAIDLGAIYEYDEKLTLAASIIDLGAIRWASNTQQFDANASIDYVGFDLRAYAASGASTDFLESLIDSIAETFQFSSTSNKPYWSTLSPELYIGASYRIYPKVLVSALTRTEFYDKRPHFALTLAGMYSPLPFLHGTLSYSMMNNKYNHLGVGISMGGKGAQFYFVTDNIPTRWVKDTSSGALWPYNARTLNFRLGVNLVFGCEDKDRGKSGRRPGSRSGKYCPAYD
ncbi:DUF5723 family protein [Bacteroidota bacterium]